MVLLIVWNGLNVRLYFEYKFRNSTHCTIVFNGRNVTTRSRRVLFLTHRVQQQTRIEQRTVQANESTIVHVSFFLSFFWYSFNRNYRFVKQHHSINILLLVYFIIINCNACESVNCWCNWRKMSATSDHTAQKEANSHSHANHVCIKKHICINTWKNERSRKRSKERCHPPK